MPGLFYTSLFCLIILETSRIYLIMPMPGSQESDHLDLAYFLHHNRWYLRIVLTILLVISGRNAFQLNKWAFTIATVGTMFLLYQFNFRMNAESIFLQPSYLTFANATGNQVDGQRLVIGIADQDQAKAYPIQFLGYHHQVVDSIASRPVIITYCTVCRTGRVYEPLVDGRRETFRLVGMDRYNAMFEDYSTGSWWRQVNGEAVTGKNKGKELPEFPSFQTSLNQWLALYPQSLIMQPDPEYVEIYDSLSNYETGNRKGKLTRRDTIAWQDKSWVVGLEIADSSKAYDWITLEKERIIHDVVGQRPILLILAGDQKSFFALERESLNQHFVLHSDTLYSEGNRFNLLGKPADQATSPLKSLSVYQEYWHSWRTFHPATTRYPHE